MPKIVFIEPKAIDEHIFAQFKLPRLGILILGTMAKEAGWDVEIITENLTPIIIDDLLDADIVGISVITNTADKGYELADILHSHGITTIIGGPHATFMPDEALAHADFVLRGETENSFIQFLTAWQNSRDYSQVPGLSYKEKDVFTHNPMGITQTDMDSLPLIDFSLIKNHQDLRIIPVQTSRGCPYDCSFCSVTGMFGRKFRYRSTENIMKELRRYRDSGKMIFFYDDHFAAHPSRAKELLRAMIHEGLNFQWSTQVRVEIAHDRELVSLMKQAGCHTLFIGFESVNPESLIEMKKNQTIDDIIKAVETIHQFDIHIHGMFVYGFNKDTIKTVKETIRFATKLDITSAQFLILTPFPGTRLRHELRYRIATNEWGLYDTHHVVFHPRNFTMKELQTAQVKSHSRFYSFKRIVRMLFQRRWIALGLSFYARYVNFLYKIKNKDYFKSLIVMDKKYSLEKTPEAPVEPVTVHEEEKVAR